MVHWPSLFLSSPHCTCCHHLGVKQNIRVKICSSQPHPKHSTPFLSCRLHSRITSSLLAYWPLAFLTFCLLLLSYSHLILRNGRILSLPRFHVEFFLPPHLMTHTMVTTSEQHLRNLQRCRLGHSFIACPTRVLMCSSARWGLLTILPFLH